MAEASLKALRAADPGHNPGLWNEIDAYAIGGQHLLDVARDPQSHGIDRDILIRRAGEPNKWYEERLRRATTLGYMGSIINHFGACVMSDPPSIETDSGNADPAFYALFSDDVDRGGTDLVEFLRARLVEALKFRTTFVLVDFPSIDPERQPSTQLEDDAMGTNRAFLVPIKPHQVLALDRDTFGRPVYARIRTRRTIRDRIHHSKDRIREEFREIFPGRIEKYVVEWEVGKPLKADTIVQSTTIESRIDMFPLVEFDCSLDLWVGNLLLPAERDLFNMINAQRWAAYMSAFPFIVAKRNSIDDEVGRLSDGMVITLEKDESIDWKENQGTAIAKIGSILDRTREEIHRVTHQLVNAVQLSPSAFQQSGESKARDRTSTLIVCRAIGNMVREFALKILDRVANGRNEEVVFSVRGMTDLDHDWMSRLGALTGIESPTAKAEVQKRAARHILTDASPDLLEVIDSEIDRTVGVVDEEIASGNPVRVIRRGSRYLVVEPDNKIVGTHDTREAALRQLRAIEASS